MTQTLDPGILNASPYGVRAGGEGARGGSAHKQPQHLRYIALCLGSWHLSALDSPSWFAAEAKTGFVSEKPWPSGSAHESAPMMRLTSRKAQPRIRDHGNINT